MSSTTLPAPLGPAIALPPAAPAAPPRARRGRLGLHLRLMTACVGVPIVGLGVLCVLALPGWLAVLGGALGLAGVAAVAAAQQWLATRLVAPALQASRAARRMSEGDLAQPVPQDAAGELAMLLRALGEVREKLFQVVSEVRAGTSHVAMNSSQITRDNEALSQRTGTQADSLQQTAASMEELTATVRQNAETAREANALVGTAAGRAEHGGVVVREMAATMGSIRDSSRSICDIIGVIDGIAFQTNVLALNAAVEAARAGEQGRGFAVVAGEVRTLAQRCATAAREVRQLIDSSVEKVELGGRRVDEAGQAMGEIVEAVQQLSGLIGQIDAASREQSAGIESINDAIARIDRVTQDNFALVQDASGTASALHQRAVTLMRRVSTFDLGEREHGNADEAVALVRRACEFHRAHGRAGLIAEVNKLAEGRFIDRDLYLMVIGMDSVFLAHGNNPRTLGNGPQSKDVDGKRFVQEMTEVARGRGEGWVTYKWAHPITNEVLRKSTYVRRAGDVVVACGIYA